MERILALLAECMNLIIKKIKWVIGWIHTSDVSTSSTKCNNQPKHKENCSSHINQNTCVAKFNLLMVRDLFAEFRVDMNRGAALRVLIDTIEAKTYSDLINDFYYTATDVESILQKWDNINCRHYFVRPTRCADGTVYVLQEDIDLYLRNRKIYVQPDTRLEQKVELLINHSFKKGYYRFVKRYESRINILKSDNSCTQEFDSIKSEMKSYIDFK